jgi:hypothetical protein
VSVWGGLSRLVRRPHSAALTTVQGRIRHKRRPSPSGSCVRGPLPFISFLPLSRLRSAHWGNRILRSIALGSFLARCYPAQNLGGWPTTSRSKFPRRSGWDRDRPSESSHPNNLAQSGTLLKQEIEAGERGSATTAENSGILKPGFPNDWG